MAVLYRKYRPQTFSDVVNQKPIITTLQNQIREGKVSHAYLFTGSRGVGKTSVARILAKAVNCVKRSEYNESHPNDPKSDACGECSICKAVENGNFIDLIEIDAASNTGVDNVRDLIEHVKFAPSSGKYKVFIIDEVHMLSRGAFNALLKTLEEPPAHAIFILATTEIQKVPATIISRTQRFDFKALPDGDLKNHLKNIAEKENLKYADEIFDLVASHAQGSVRDALSILDKISTLGEEVSGQDARAVLGVTDEHLLGELLRLIAGGQAKDLPGFFDGLLERGVDASVFNKDFLEFLRKALVAKITLQELGGPGEAAALLSVNELIFVIRLFLKAYKDLQTAPSAEIPLLLAAIEGALRKTGAQASTPKTALPLSGSLPQNTQAAAIKPMSSAHPAPAVSTTNFDNSTLEEVLEFWPKVISAVKEENGPLGSLLRACQPASVVGGKISLQVKYQFDKKTLEKNYSFLTEKITKISGKNLGIAALVAESAAVMPSAVTALSDALQVFGGELVE